jgi:hypothetical protein
LSHVRYRNVWCFLGEQAKIKEIEAGGYIKKKLKRSYKDFEEIFRVLLEKAKKGSVSVHALLTALGGRGRILLLIFLSLGFGQIPGVAIFLGLFIGYLGLRIAMGRSAVWMPKRFLYKKIPSYFLIKVIQQILRLLKFMKKWSHPRYVWATQKTSTRVINGLMISFVGLSFALAPPVPLAGFIAFIAIFSISIGLLNDDGMYIMAGYFFAIFYFVLTFFLLKFCSLTQMVDWVFLK